MRIGWQKIVTFSSSIESEILGNSLEFKGFKHAMSFGINIAPNKCREKFKILSIKPNHE